MRVGAAVGVIFGEIGFQQKLSFILNVKQNLSAHCPDPVVAQVVTVSVLQIPVIALMSYLIKDCRRPKSQAFFYHFWAVSTHDRFVSSMRERSYGLFFSQIRELCFALNPDISDDVLKQRCYLIMSLVEGMHVIYGNQRKMPESLDRIENEFLKQANLIACSP